MRAPAREVIDAAVAAGIELFDTADVYGTEELLVEVPTVVTKGGLLPGWRPDGRAKHLTAAAAASAARLGRAPDYYLLHAVDPAVPLATSVRALEKAREDGVVRAIGLSNVNRAQLEEALAIAPIAAVEVELSPRRTAALRGGLVSLCRERGILVLAHRPLGARSWERDVELCAIAARHEATPAEIVLAWIVRQGAVPIPGATTIEHARSAARAGRLALDDDAIAALDGRFLDLVRAGAAPRRDGEVVIVMGIPAAGKTTAVAAHVARGYLRLNRDERGGKLDQLARALDDALAEGAEKVVLDNTYPTRSSRAPVIAAARRHGVRARCVWLDTALEDAQVNAVTRILDKHGRLLEPDELRAAAKRDPNTFAPGVQFRWRRELEPPAVDEGFDAIEVVPFARAPRTGAHRGLLVELEDYDAEVANRWRDAGWIVALTSWQRTDAPAGVELASCPHPAGPPVCWCRKPLPGLGLVLARRLDLDLGRSIHVGHGPADRGFAARLGLRYLDAAEWISHVVVP